MPEYTEKRKSKNSDPIIGDRNRLRRKDDLPLKGKLLETIASKSQSAAYLTPVSGKQVEMELAQGHIRALVDGSDEITAHVRCLPISDDTSFIMTLHGKTRAEVLEILEQIAPDRRIILEVVKKHLQELGITEDDLISMGFERTSPAKLGLAHLFQTNFYYFKSDPIKFIKGFFQQDVSPDEYVVFNRGVMNLRNPSSR